ncbi:MAG: peptidoglycan-associated lipoprotein Pal [Planktomarina sp.]
MTRLTLLIPVIALAACTKANPDPDAEYRAPVGTGVNSTQVTTNTLAPNSPAFFSQTVGDRVLFDVDQYKLNAAGRAVLDGQATWLMTNPEYQIRIEGHADEQGTREYNLALGARRAQAVQTYLLSKGVSQSRLKTLSFGKERPIEICSSESCYTKNRRAVTVLAGGIS